MISKWFSLYERTEKKIILQNKMKDVRKLLVESVRDNNNEQRDKLLKIYGLLLVEFENV
ncbi:hypothetical protein [Photobacterium piscicola]|uniref:hypothetical protein n=1 Tax=Photobacterium piscicola TaxID=1378299 RepID=UPI0037365665